MGQDANVREFATPYLRLENKNFEITRCSHTSSCPSDYNTGCSRNKTHGEPFTLQFELRNDKKNHPYQSVTMHNSHGELRQNSKCIQ